MKQITKWLAIVFVASGGAMMAQAQTLTPLVDFTTAQMSASYGSWATLDTWGDPITPNPLHNTATGLQVTSQGGYGSGAFNFVTPINASGATAWQLTFTINTTMKHDDGSGLWVGPNLDISDGTHMVHLFREGGPFMNYGAYNSGTYTLTGGFADQNGAAPLDLTTITAFNLEFDPAEFGNGAYDITYNKLTLSSPVAVPEPSTIALLALGALGIMIKRSRSKVS